ncbi:MAG: MBL fold metallo-hydrolase [Candidatus Omnitrophota bacterium]|nr:MAG: MBL fold metallo-hydrolase [Candidatus Omnitrophota bacterium]
MSHDSIEIHTLAVGPLQANCHIVLCSHSREALIVDPGDEGESIVRFLQSLDAKPIMILNTHGHGDHIGANGFLKDTYAIPLAIHTREAHMLVDPEANLSGLLGIPILSPPADRTFQDGDLFPVGSAKVKVLETAGHSPGGSSFLIENHVLTGDALFKRSIGRTDFDGCSHERLIRGIKEKLLTLPDGVIVYPGHGPNTMIGEERRKNPFLQ